jgi:hypothetical protein
VHPRPLPQLGCSPVEHGKHIQFGVKKGHISKNCVVGGDIMQLSPFVRAFYAFEFPLFYNHYNHEGYVILIPFTMGTRLGDPLGGPLFTLAHFRALHSTISHFFFI